MSKVLIAILVTALAGAAYAEVPLRYRCEVGASTEFTIENDFNLPILGSQPSRVVVRSTVVSSANGTTHVRQSIDRTRPNLPARTVDTQLTIDHTGEIEHQGELPSDSEGIFLARTTMLLLPALPDRVVRVGSTWSAQRTVPLPPMKISAPPQVRVSIDYKVEKVEDGKVQVAMSAKTLPGESLTLTHTGHLTLDAETGRPLSGWIDGKASLWVFLMGTQTASFKIKLVNSTQSSPALASTQRISLLGIQ